MSFGWRWCGCGGGPLSFGPSSPPQIFLTDEGESARKGDRPVRNHQAISRRSVVMSKWKYDAKKINGGIYGDYVSLYKKAAQNHHRSLRDMDRALYTPSSALWVFDGPL